MVFVMNSDSPRWHPHMTDNRNAAIVRKVHRFILDSIIISIKITAYVSFLLYMGKDFLLAPGHGNQRERIFEKFFTEHRSVNY